MRAANPPNVLLVVLDCVRAKSLERWGGTHTAKTPYLDHLADDSVVFSRAVAPSNWTLPSHRAMLTGAPASALPNHRPAPPPGPLAQWLGQAHGYDTAMFTENDVLAGGLGLEDGFYRLSKPAGMHGEIRWSSVGGSLLRSLRHAAYGDRAVSALRRFPMAGPAIAAVENLRHQSLKRSVCNGQIIREFARWLAGHPEGQPYFALVNVMDAHEPFRNPSEWSLSGLRDLGYRMVFRNHALMVPQLRHRIPWTDLERGYHWEIQQADAKLGELLRAVQTYDDFDRTIVIVTGDHGQCFGEGGFVYHGNGSAEAVARVPLLIRVPGEASRQCDRWVSLSEIPAWIGSWVQGNQPPGDVVDDLENDGNRAVYCDGRPAWETTPLLQGRFPHEPWNRRLIAVYHENAKYVADIDARAVSRWDLLQGDPDSTPPEPLGGRERKAAWQSLIEPYLAQSDPTGTFRDASSDDPSTLRALRSWGYV